MAEHDVKYLEKIEMADGIKSFRFERPEGFDYSPGQFFFINIQNDAGNTIEHHFTLSSSPTESYIEFTARMTGSDFKNAMDSLEIGTKVHIKGPYGVFTPSPEMKKVAYLCGGIGVTPARPAIKWAVDTESEIDIVLLFGNKDLESIPFKDEFDAVNKDSIKIVYVLSRQDDWTGPKGHISAKIIETQIPDWKDRMFFVSGPPPMVESIKKILMRSFLFLPIK